MNRIVVYDVPNEGKGSLSRDVWWFWFLENRAKLVLDYYAHEERTSLRQKFKPTRAYNRLRLSNRDYRCEDVSEADAPLPPWVMDAAKEEFFKMVKVGKWNRG